MDAKISAIKGAFKRDLELLKENQEVELLRIKYLGKKGKIQELLLDLKTADPKERPSLGKLVNQLKEELESLCAQAAEVFGKAEEAKRFSHERLDISLPAKKSFIGRHHPIRLLLREVTDILKGMGFSIQTGPKIDSDWYNFEGLNYPADHPARDMQDTFYISEKFLLRSQTSNVQIRTMEKYKPPIRVIAPGGVFRNETVSARSHVFFHQVEGMYIDEKVSLSDLFSTMDELWSKLFQTTIETRFRPSYFPFVEPGVEVDIKCTNCSGKGCRLCKQSGWLEVAGAGMIHPEVLKSGGIDPHVYSGYAWGMGIERLAMLRYEGFNDIRMFSENDLRVLSQVY